MALSKVPGKKGKGKGLEINKIYLRGAHNVLWRKDVNSFSNSVMHYIPSQIVLEHYTSGKKWFILTLALMKMVGKCFVEGLELHLEFTDDLILSGRQVVENFRWRELGKGNNF